MMKRVFILSLFLGVLSFSFSIAQERTYTCYRYVNGEPTGGFVKVKASSKDEAEKKSYQKYKELGYKLDYTKCVYEVF